MNAPPTLGEVTSDKPKVLEQLAATGIKTEYNIPVPGTTQKTIQHVTAAAGSASELPCIEAELKQEPQTGTPIPKPSTSSSGSVADKAVQPEPTTSSTRKPAYEPQVGERPFSIKLVKLSKYEIDHHLGKSKLKKPEHLLVKKCSISIRKLPLTPMQSVTITKLPIK